MAEACRERNRYDHSGLVAAASTDQFWALTCWVTFAPTPDTVFNVSGANGSLPGILQEDYSGGTPPYTDSLTLQNDPSGKLVIQDNGRGADTIFYNGFSLNEVEGCWVKYVVTDGTGAKVTARFPASGSISITRTS